MIPTLCENEIIRWLPQEAGSERFERILWGSSKSDEVVLIELFNKMALPITRKRQDIIDAITGRFAEITVIEVTHERYIENEISEKYKSRRDKAWKIISELVASKEEPHIYDPSYRGQRVIEICLKYRCTKTTVYQYLRKYWQGGKAKNALLPKYWNCGSPGKEKSATTAKRGRPRKITMIEPDKVGVNVDEDIKQRFRSGIRLFYNNRQERPLYNAPLRQDTKLRKLSYAPFCAF